MLIDSLIIYTLLFLVGLILALLGILTVENSSKFTEYGLFFIVFAGYYFTFESIVGKTPAKFITKTRVVDYDNNQPGKMTILGRTLCRFIPFDGLSFLGLSGFHDKFSNTKVIIDKPQII